MAKWSIQQLADLCKKVGFTDEQIPMAIAICLAESGGDDQAVNTEGNTPPSRDRGLWQINDYWHKEVNDACAFDPTCNAQAAQRISGGHTWTQWATFNNGAFRPFLKQAQETLIGGVHMGMGFWAVRNPWNTMLAIDEFGPGTKDGNPADGWSNDACGPASLENSEAAYEQRAPSYTKIGSTRQDMLHNGHFTAGGGCSIDDVAWAANRHGGYSTGDLRSYDGHVLSRDEVYHFLATHPGHPHIFLVTDAEALAGNEHGVFGHFVSITAYGGDNADGSYGRVYVLNSDIAGQHGLATGQWMTIDQFCAGKPSGHVALFHGAQNGPAPAPKPTEKPVLIFHKDASGKTTSATDANNPSLILYEGFAQMAEQKNWQQGSISVPETKAPGIDVNYAVLRGGAKVAMTYKSGVGVEVYGGGVVEVLDALYHNTPAPTSAPPPPAPAPKPNYDSQLGTLQSAVDSMKSALKGNGEAS